MLGVWCRDGPLVGCIILLYRGKVRRHEGGAGVLMTGTSEVWGASKDAHRFLGGGASCR